MQLDHVTIRTKDPGAVKSFFLTVFDEMQAGSRPKAIQHIPGFWLYAGDKPILHLIATNRLGQDPQSEAWDHVAFRLKGYHKFRARLENLGIYYSPMDLPELSERRLFFKTPEDLLVETVFRESQK